MCVIHFHIRILYAIHYSQARTIFIYYMSHICHLHSYPGPGSTRSPSSLLPLGNQSNQGTYNRIHNTHGDDDVALYNTPMKPNRTLNSTTGGSGQSIMLSDDELGAANND